MVHPQKKKDVWNKKQILQKENDPKVALFLQALAAERGVRPLTCKAYSEDLSALSSFFQSRALETLDQSDLQAYLAHFYARECSPRTSARHLAALRQFYGFLEEEGLIQDNPTRLLKTPTYARTLPRVLDIASIESLITSCPETSSGLRARAVIRVLYGSGLRISEMLTLKWRDVTSFFTSFQEDKTNSPLPSLIIKGKGGKERSVFLPPLVLSDLQAYRQDLGKQYLGEQYPDDQSLGERKAYLDGHKDYETSPCLHDNLSDFDNLSNSFIFSSRDGKPLTRQRIHQILKACAREAGLNPQKISAHVLRHSFATHLLENGLDFLALQKLLGHEQIATTELYTHLVKDHLIDLVYTHHPLQKRSDLSKT